MMNTLSFSANFCVTLRGQSVHKNRKYIVVLSVALTALLLSCTSCNKTPNESDTKGSRSGPNLYVDKTVIDLGEIRTDKIVEAKFLLKNTGKSDLIIRRIKTSCGCTTPNIEDGAVIASGKSRELLIKFNPVDKEGHVRHTILLTTNDEEKPETAIRIIGNVIKNYDNLTIIPESLSLGLLRKQPLEKILLARFPESVDFNDVCCFSTAQYIKAKLLSIEQAPAIFDYDIKRIKSRNLAVVYVEFTSGMLLGKIIESITIASKSNSFLPVTVPIVGFLEEPLTCELVPSQLIVLFPSEKSVARKHLVLYACRDCKDIALEVASAPKGFDLTIEKIKRTVGRYDVYIKIERHPEIVFKRKGEIVFRIMCGQRVFDRPVSFVAIK